MRWLFLIALACREPMDVAADAGVADAGRLRAPEEVLAPSAYDCTSSGPYEPPARPHPFDCHRDPSCAARLVSAHRIGTPFAPENSVSALRAAILLGADMVETDLRLSSDGALVFIHDAEVDRTFEATGNVEDLTLAELKTLPMKTGDRAGDFGCERIPTMDEVFALARGRVVVELEVKRIDAAPVAARYLRDHDLYRDAFLLCDLDECAAARAEVPDVPIMPRPQQPEDVPAALAFEPAPILVHVDPNSSFLVPSVLDPIRARGAKVFVNAIILGDGLAIGNDLSGYTSVYEMGVDAALFENVHWALVALGRLP